jgi:hypothetical protein
VFIEPRSVAADVIPRGLGPDKNMHLDLNSRVSIHTSEGQAVNLSLPQSAKRGTAAAAESDGPAAA